MRFSSQCRPMDKLITSDLIQQGHMRGQGEKDEGLVATTCHSFWFYSCLFEYSTEVGITLGRMWTILLTISLMVVLWWRRGRGACGNLSILAGNSVLRSKSVEELNPFPPMGSNLQTPHQRLSQISICMVASVS